MTSHFYLNKIDKKYPSVKNKIYAGKWCFLDQDLLKIDSKKKKLNIIKNIWEDNHAHKYDYQFCKYLAEVLSEQIGSFLNNVNNLKKGKRYWKIVLLPWLARYLPIYLYRWRTIEKALKIDKQLSIFELREKKNFTPQDTLNFVELVKDNDEYNYLIYLKILKEFKNYNQYNIKFLKKKNIRITYKIKKKNLFKKYIFQFLFQINTIFSINNSIFLENNLLKKKNYFKFCNKLKIFPQFFLNKSLENNEVIKLKNNLVLRNKLKFFLRIKKKNFSQDYKFIKFLINNIGNDIPKCFIEGYNFIKKNTNTIKIHPKLIFSGFSYLYDEIFKIWVAEYVNSSNAKFFICSHGGGSIYKIDANLELQSIIADKFITYAKPRNKKEVQLGPLKFIDIKKISGKFKILSYVGSPNYKYPTSIAKNKFCNLNNYKNIFGFREYLNQDIFDKLIYLPPKDYLEYEENKIKQILNDRYLNKRTMLHRFSRNSNLIICAYPETAFLESICLRPTVLISTKEIFKSIIIKDNLIKKLIKNKILFFNLKEASEHINNIWSHTDRWWKEKKVKETIKEFKLFFCNIDNNSFNRWIDFIKKEKIN